MPFLSKQIHTDSAIAQASPLPTPGISGFIPILLKAVLAQKSAGPGPRMTVRMPPTFFQPTDLTAPPSPVALSGAGSESQTLCRLYLLKRFTFTYCGISLALGCKPTGVNSWAPTPPWVCHPRQAFSLAPAPPGHLSSIWWLYLEETHTNSAYVKLG